MDVHWPNCKYQLWFLSHLLTIPPNSPTKTILSDKLFTEKMAKLEIDTH